MLVCINNYMENKSKWWNNGTRNTRSVESPGEGWSQGRLKFKRRGASDETKRKISESLKGNVAWNKGKTGIYSEETRKQMSESAKERVKRGILPDNTGKKPWNYGLDVSDPRVSGYVEKQTGQIREGNYNMADYDLEEFKGFQKETRLLTEKTYKRCISEINPDGHKRGTAGQKDVYQLDHIVPIIWGFNNGLTPEELSRKENLRMIKWEDNLSRSKLSLCEDGERTLKLLKFK